MGILGPPKTLKPYIHTVFGNLHIRPFYKPRLFQTQNTLVKVGVPHLNPLLGDSLYSTYPPTTNPEGPQKTRVAKPCLHPPKCPRS